MNNIESLNIILKYVLDNYFEEYFWLPSTQTNNLSGESVESRIMVTIFTLRSLQGHI